MFDYEHLFGPFFHELADAAGEIALLYFRKNIIVDEKEDKTPVTCADREIEQKLREMIQSRFPDHGVIGEEFGSYNAGAEFVWVLDPIDGTKSFIVGRPLFGTLIGLAHKGKPVMGCVDQAFTKERWVGVAGKSCQLNGVDVHVAGTRAMASSRAFTYVPSGDEKAPVKGGWFLRDGVKLMHYNCDCYAYALVAMGCADFVVEHGLGIHDVVGIVPIVTGAGGFVCDWGGKPIDLNADGTIVAASCESLAREVLEALNHD